MRGRLRVMIGLDLDDDAADAVDQQRRPDQVGRDLENATVKKRAFQRLAETRDGRAGRLCVLNHFEVGIRSEQVKTANILHVSARFGDALPQPSCGLPQRGLQAVAARIS